MEEAVSLFGSQHRPTAPPTEKQDERNRKEKWEPPKTSNHPIWGLDGEGGRRQKEIDVGHKTNWSRLGQKRGRERKKKEEIGTRQSKGAGDLNC